jgi:hypothetical protein
MEFRAETCMTSAPKRRWSSIIGTILVAMGAIMMQFATAVFVSTEEPSQATERIGTIAFFAFCIQVVLCLVLFIICFLFFV